MSTVETSSSSHEPWTARGPCTGADINTDEYSCPQGRRADQGESFGERGPSASAEERLRERPRVVSSRLLVYSVQTHSILDSCVGNLLGWLVF